MMTDSERIEELERAVLKLTTRAVYADASRRELASALAAYLTMLARHVDPYPRRDAAKLTPYGESRFTAEKLYGCAQVPETD